MEKTKQVVFDAGPFIHLSEIQEQRVMRQYLKILTTPEIIEECFNIKAQLLAHKNMVVIALRGESKDFAKYLTNKYDLDLGESTGIALCKQEAIRVFFTDDLAAREVTQQLGFVVHGTLGLLLRAYRKKILTREEVENGVHKLYMESSLFLTKELYEWTMKEIEKFK